MPGADHLVMNMTMKLGAATVKRSPAFRITVVIASKGGST
jgi:hypothetical protein